MAKENISLNVPQAADDFKMLFPFHGFIINVSSTNARMIWTKPCSS